MPTRSAGSNPFRSAVPRRTVPFLRSALLPDREPPDPKQVARLLAELDDDRYRVRERASQALEQLGRLVEPNLNGIADTSPSLEVRRRAVDLLKKLNDRAHKLAALGGLRSVEVLESLNTPEARAVLQAVTERGPTARLRREAKTSLARLARRPAVP